MLQSVQNLALLRRRAVLCWAVSIVWSLHGCDCASTACARGGNEAWHVLRVRRKGGGCCAECRMRKVGIKGDVACGFHASGLSRIRTVNGCGRTSSAGRADGEARDKKYCDGAATASLGGRLPSSCFHWVNMAAFGSQFPKTHRPSACQGRWCEFQLSSNLTTGRTTTPSNRNPHPAAKLSTPRKPNSQWPSNRLPAYVLPLGVLGSREQGTNDWNRCSAVRSCSTFPLLRVRGELVADFWSFLQLRRGSEEYAPRTGELG
jgi:hypothetical protein